MDRLNFIPARFFIMKEKKKNALKESLVTVGLGLILNWPISIVFLYIFIDRLALGTFETSIYMTIGFTLVAVLRVYVIRLYYSKDD